MSFSALNFLKGTAVFVAAGLLMCTSANAQVNCPNENGGDCFVGTPGIPGCADGSCCSLVCAELAFCCEVEWDDLCAAFAVEICVCTQCGDGACGDCFVDAAGTANPYANDQCDGKDCPGCCTTVCTVDPYCCNTDWDGLCVGEAIDLCECLPEDIPGNDDCANATVITLGTTNVTSECATPDGPEHASCTDGFVVGLGLDIWFLYTADFTGDLGITPSAEAGWLTQMAVYQSTDCAQLEDPPYACAPLNGGVIIGVTEGSSYLIRLGGNYQGSSGTGTLSLVPADFPACNAGVGSCVEAHEGVGCDDSDCCLAICLVDPLCCTVEWDEACAIRAASDCAAMPCTLDLSSATYNEIELCGEDSNGGCNSAPFAFETINSGDIVAGTAWADAASRDTDWYVFSNNLADFDTNGDGMVDIHHNLIGELSVVSFTVVHAANDECGTNISTGTTGSSQSCIQTGTGITTVGITDLVHVFVGTADSGGNPIFEGFPCPPPGPGAFGANYLLCATVTDDGEALDTECPPVSNPCPWDLDGGGSVGTSDLLDLLSQWGGPGTADFDGSGAVGTSDLLALLANWGPCP